MRLLESFAVAFFLLLALVSAHPIHEEFAGLYTERTPAGGFHVPIVRRDSLNTNSKRAAVGLGDTYDLIYSALVTINGTTLPLVVDTGSSDLWVVSDACRKGCGTGKTYPQATLRSAGIGIELDYGDSQTATFASGLVGFDTVDFGGADLTSQTLVAVNSTNTTIIEGGLSGLLGLGFPINSVITNTLFKQNSNSSISARDAGTRNTHFGSSDSRRQTFPSFSEVFHVPSTESRHQTRQSTPWSPSVVQAFVDSWSKSGPFVPRLITQGAIPEPLIAITLQRDVIDIGGNLGMLSIGEFPASVKSSNLTWAYLRNYTTALGGLPAPADSPSEVYPITWEIMIDNVYLDGQLLPMSNLTPPGIGVSALIDTGSSLLHGPEDVVSYIQQQLSPAGTFNCAQPHNLSFEIGGKLFPVDPRDFATQSSDDILDGCIPTLTATDAPKVGGYLFSWALGVPFLKGVLSSFYYGNISYPSHDAPRMGFLSTVPSNAGDLMEADAAAAAKANGFPAISQAAPSVVPSPTATDSEGVPQAYTSPTNVPASTSTNSTATNSLGSTSGSGESCCLVCSSLSYLSSTAYLALIVAVGLW